MWRLVAAGVLWFLAAYAALSCAGRKSRGGRSSGVAGRGAAPCGAEAHEPGPGLAPPAWARGLAEGIRATPAVRRARERERDRELADACERQMPELLDILALGLSAGLSFDASLELYCARSDTELAREALGALRSWQMGIVERGRALEALAARARSPSLERFSAAVTEALAFGTPLAQALERQAQTIREEQRARTRQRLEEAPVRMLIPLGTMVVPAMLLAIMGPLVAAAMSK